VNGKNQCKNNEVIVVTVEEKDFISLTDMANAKEGKNRVAVVLKNWLINRYTIKS
jgi:hypothetical protein